jgi:hypothetical protein
MRARLRVGVRACACTPCAGCASHVPADCCLAGSARCGRGANALTPTRELLGLCWELEAGSSERRSSPTEALATAATSSVVAAASSSAATAASLAAATWSVVARQRPDSQFLYMIVRLFVARDHFCVVVDSACSLPAYALSNHAARPANVRAPADVGPACPLAAMMLSGEPDGPAALRRPQSFGLLHLVGISCRARVCACVCACWRCRIPAPAVVAPVTGQACTTLWRALG